MMLAGLDRQRKQSSKVSAGVIVAALLAAAVAMVVTAPAAPLASEFDQKVEDALQGDWGKFSFNIRWRFEYVDQQDKGIARGDPFRVRFGYLTPDKSNFRGFVELEANGPVFVYDYNSTRNGKTEYPVIADPAELELNRGWVSYSGLENTSIKALRQRIIYNNARFIGNVGWRQMEQTYDAISIVNTSLENATLRFAYLWNIRTITSRSVNVNAPLLNLGYSFSGLGELAAYGYWLDYKDADNSADYAFSTQTYGARFHGATTFAENFDALYAAEYARQMDYGDNRVDYGADYFHVIGGVKFAKSGDFLSNITAKVGWESLGSDNGVGFKTPLGTNHAFQGWADKFLVTPGDGIVDLYGDVSLMLAGIKLQAVYHQFDADEGGANYGNEFDALISKKFGKHYTLAVKYANYSAKDLRTDTEKFWTQVTIGF